MNRFHNLLKDNILKMMTVFLFTLPFLDLITSLSINVFQLSFNFIIILKMLVMIILVYYLFFITKTKEKKISVIYLLMIFLYSMIYLAIILHDKGSDTLMYEFQNLMRAFYFPINLICLWNIYKEKKLNITEKHLTIILFIYIILLFIPTITNTGFNSYAYSKEGSLGWFYSTNEIGAILSILLPLAISYLFNLKQLWIKLFIVMISLYTYFSLGTKVPILSIGIIASLILLQFVIKQIQQKKVKKIILMLMISIVTIVGLVLIIPKTSFYKNIVIHLEFLEINEVKDFLDIDAIDDFIFSERITFYKNTLSNYQQATNLEKLIGIGYIENYGTDQVNTKMIEMDYYDIFFRHGILGTILFFIPLLIVLYKIISKITITDKLYQLYISIFLILLLALFSGHVLISPSVSIIVIYILLLTLETRGEL